MNFTFLVGAGEYDPVLYMVDADSNIDGVANYADHISGTYLNTQTLDGSYQNRSEDYGGLLSPDNSYVYENYTDPSGYIYDPTKINVSNGYVQLQGTTTSGDNHTEHARWEFNEGTGNDTYDTTLDTPSFPNWNASLVNDAYWANSSKPTLNKEVVIPFGSYVNLTADGHGSALGDWEYNDTFSVSVWVNNSDTGNFGSIISNMHEWNVGWNIYNYFGKLQVDLCNDPFTPKRILIKTVDHMGQGVLKHVVVTYNGGGNASDITVYVNGVSQAITITADNLNNNTIKYAPARGVLVGKRANNMNFTGSIAQLIMFDKELNSTEIAWLYNSGLGTEEPHIFSYPINSVDATIVSKTPVDSIGAMVGVYTSGIYTAGTSVRFQFSPNNGTSWFRKVGATWYVAAHTWAQAMTPVAYLLAMPTYHNTFPNGGNFSTRVFFRTTDSTVTPRMDWSRIELPNWKMAWEHEFQTVEATEKYNLSVYLDSYNYGIHEGEEDLYVQYWNNSTWVNATLDGSVKYLNGSQTAHWANITVDNLQVVGGNITIRYMQNSGDLLHTAYNMDYVELLAWFSEAYITALAPVIVAWFDSTLLIDPFANVLFDCTIYDPDSNETQLNANIFYSIDGFALDNRSVNMSFATQVSPDHYKFTYLWAGEAAGVFYQYYYQVNDSYRTVRKPANYESGILFDIQWDLVIISPAGDFIGGWIEAAREIIEPNNRWLYWLLLLSLALSSFAVIKRNKNRRY